jgi:hypothetical protein
MSGDFSYEKFPRGIITLVNAFFAAAEAFRASKEIENNTTRFESEDNFILVGLAFTLLVTEVHFRC